MAGVDAAGAGMGAAGGVACSKVRHAGRSRASPSSNCASRRKLGWRRHTPRSAMSSGTATRAPEMPHSQPQNNTASNTEIGLSESLRPTTQGLIRLVSTAWMTTKAAAGASIDGRSPKLTRPAISNSPTIASGPRYGTKHRTATSTPHTVGSGRPSACTASPVTTPAATLRADIATR